MIVRDRDLLHERYGEHAAVLARGAVGAAAQGRVGLVHDASLLTVGGGRVVVVAHAVAALVERGTHLGGGGEPLEVGDPEVAHPDAPGLPRGVRLLEGRPRLRHAAAPRAAPPRARRVDEQKVDTAHAERAPACRQRALVARCGQGCGQSRPKRRISRRCPKLAGAWGSLRQDLALEEASRAAAEPHVEPAWLQPRRGQVGGDVGLGRLRRGARDLGGKEDGAPGSAHCLDARGDRAFVVVDVGGVDA